MYCVLCSCTLVVAVVGVQCRWWGRWMWLVVRWSLLWLVYSAGHWTWLVVRWSLLWLVYSAVGAAVERDRRCRVNPPDICSFVLEQDWHFTWSNPRLFPRLPSKCPTEVEFVFWTHICVSHTCVIQVTYYMGDLWQLTAHTHPSPQTTRPLASLAGYTKLIRSEARYDLICVKSAVKPQSTNHRGYLH